MARLPFTPSHSSLDKFENCPRAYQAQYCTKEVQWKDSAPACLGTCLHKLAEWYIDMKVRDDCPVMDDIFHVQLSEGTFKAVLLETRVSIPPTYDELRKHWSNILDVLNKMPFVEGAYIDTEVKLCVNNDFVSAAYMSKNGFFRAIVDVLIKIGDQAILIDWKGFPLDTKIPTPSGWTTMRDISVGDEVYGRDGNIYPVIGKSEVNSRECYRVEFDDSSAIVCDDKHQWTLLDGSVVNIEDLKRGDYMPMCEPVRGRRPELLIHPYVLGLWLADGCHSGGTITKPYQDVWDAVTGCGYKYSEPQANGARNVYGLRTRLVALGLLGHKRIPDAYMRGDTDQRIDLLRGLMDGDGNANPKRKQVVFNTTDVALAEQVLELVRSLGQRAYVSPHKSTGFGKTVNEYYVSWRPTKSVLPFRLRYKGEQVDFTSEGRSGSRRVVSVEKLEGEQETQCIAVDSPDNTFVVGDWWHVTHNSSKELKETKQLQRSAMTVLLCFPQVNKATVVYVSSRGHAPITRAYTRDNIMDLINEVKATAGRLAESYELNVWPPIKSGLCKLWCDVSQCKHNGRTKAQVDAGYRG